MALKAKFECDFITEYKTAGLEATLSAVSDSQSDFTELTPLGTIKIRMQEKSRANSEIRPGKKYIMTLEEIVE